MTQIEQFSLNEMISEVEREVRMRQVVYPGLVARKKLRQSEADRLIAIMEAVADRLYKLRDLNEHP